MVSRTSRVADRGEVAVADQHRDPSLTPGDELRPRVIATGSVAPRASQRAICRQIGVVGAVGRRQHHPPAPRRLAGEHHRPPLPVALHGQQRARFAGRAAGDGQHLGAGPWPPTIETDASGGSACHRRAASSAVAPLRVAG